MGTRTRVMSGIALVTAVVLLGACGAAKVEVTGKARSLASDAASSALDTPVVIGGTTTTVPPTTAPSTTVPPTTVPSRTVPSTTVPTGAGEPGDEAFCTAAADVANAGLDSLGDLDLDRADSAHLLDRFKSTLRGVDEAVGEMDRTAPPAIAADMHTLASELHSLAASVESAQTFGAVLDSMMALDGATAGRAGKRVGAYLSEHCGFGLEGHATH